MVALKTIAMFLAGGAGFALLAFNYMIGLVWFFALFLGIMLDKFFLNAMGQAAVENMFGKNFGVFLKLSKSRRAKLEAKGLNDPLVKDGNKAFTPSEKDYFFLGNIPLVIQPEDNSMAFNPYEEIEKDFDVILQTKCSHCEKDLEVTGSTKIKVPIVMSLPSERLSGFFMRLEDWILGTLMTQSKMLIWVTAILVGLLVLLNVYNIFFATPGALTSLAGHMDGTIANAVTQIVNGTAGGSGVKVV